MLDTAHTGVRVYPTTTESLSQTFMWYLRFLFTTTMNSLSMVSQSPSTLPQTPFRQCPKTF